MFIQAMVRGRQGHGSGKGWRMQELMSIYIIVYVILYSNQDAMSSGMVSSSDARRTAKGADSARSVEKKRLSTLKSLFGGVANDPSSVEEEETKGEAGQ